MSWPRPTDIFSAAPPRVYSIDPGRPFLADLARALHQAAGDDPLTLADMLILAPTRRAVRSLTDAFAETAAGRASLLPRFRALGDIDEEELALSAPDLNAADAIDLPPAISPLERRLALTRLIAAAARAFDGQENWPTALGAASELGKLLDSFHAEEIDLARLQDAAPADHAEHWARSLKFLEIVIRAWPQYLAERGLIDPGARRARLIDRQAARFEKFPPATPVIVAGTTGSAPAVARLMRAVASLPKGAVVLPGLDHRLAADQKAWNAIDDPHPQAGLKAVLAALDVAASDVLAWPGAPAPAARGALLSLSLRPAEATDDWRVLVKAAARSDPGLEAARAGLLLVEAADENAEAAAVAILMREALETPGCTAMLVTPDRNLGRRIAAKLRRWDVIVDDSAGVPFANSPCGTYLRLVAAWLAAPADPVAILSLIRHPLAGLGLAGDERRRACDALDEALRGTAPGPDLDGVAKKLAAHEKLFDRAAPILDALNRALAFWPPQSPVAFFDYLCAHFTAAEALAADDAETGAARLWRGEDGETGAFLLAEIKTMADALGSIGAGDYADGFSGLLAGASVRAGAPAHPRLQILGPLEARLQSADLVILGGLNDGVWPAEAAVDPFLSRRMRETIGLSSPERRLGLSAHDFAQLAAAPRVVLTRARQASGAPAKPSRWIVRLKNILAGAEALASIDGTQRLAAWANALDDVNPPKPVLPPRPTPPLKARPRQLPVTQIEKWLRDPYSIYARYILGLRKLDALGEPFDARQLGLLLHKVFERAARSGATRADLIAFLNEAAPAHGLSSVEAVLWRPLIGAALDWFAEFHARRLEQGAPVVLEGTGGAVLNAKAGPFTLSATADRIDLLKNGAAYLFDYKSRSIPSKPQMETFRVQLPLTALIVERGGFETLGARPIAGYQYLRTLARKEKDNETGAEGEEAVTLARNVEEAFLRWIDAFDDPSTPYLSQPRPQFIDDFGDYDHLARRREWAAMEDGE